MHASHATEVIKVRVNFLDYTSGLFSWMGWFLFALWGGIGLVCLPVLGGAV